MEIFLLYLVLQLDSFGRFLFFVGVAATTVALITGFMLNETYAEESRKPIYKVLKQCGVAIFCSVLIATLLPTTKSATILAGAYALKEVSKTESAQKLAGRSVKLIEDWLESLEPVKKEKK